jgi:hypothetical protein
VRTYLWCCADAGEEDEEEDEGMEVTIMPGKTDELRKKMEAKAKVNTGATISFTFAFTQFFTQSCRLLFQRFVF